MSVLCAVVPTYTLISKGTSVLVGGGNYQGINHQKRLIDSKLITFLCGTNHISSLKKRVPWVQLAGGVAAVLSLIKTPVGRNWLMLMTPGKLEKTWKQNILLRETCAHI